MRKKKAWWFGLHGDNKCSCHLKEPKKKQIKPLNCVRDNFNKDGEELKLFYKGDIQDGYTMYSSGPVW